MHLIQQAQAATDRHGDMVRFAQQQQLATEFLGKPAKPGLHKTALASIGKVLSEVGDQLQQRYGEETEPMVGYQLETAG